MENAATSIMKEMQVCFISSFGRFMVRVIDAEIPTYASNGVQRVVISLVYSIFSVSDYRSCSSKHTCWVN